eukprot:SAG22_NODE_2189_length_2863_cov_3.101664_7_plen_57_part_00
MFCWIIAQVIRSKTAMGFVPNYSAGGTKSIDRTEPPIGAKVPACLPALAYHIHFVL